MRYFVYCGIPKGQKEALIRDVMDPLESDFHPTPGVGGFPIDKHGNPSQYYPDTSDQPAVVAMKEKNRKKYRAERLAEIKKDLEKSDKEISFFGRPFPNGEPVGIEDPKGPRDPMNALINKLEALCKTEMFKEVSGPGKKAEVKEESDDSEKRGPGRPKKVD